MAKLAHKTFTFLGICSLALSLACFSADEVSDHSHLPVRGSGTYSWFFIDVYIATLYTPIAHSNKDLYQAPLRLRLKYLRDFKGSDIADRSRSEMESAGVGAELLDKWQPLMNKFFPDVKKGDSIEALYTPNKAIQFYLNKKRLLGESKDAQFAKAFLNIWLGEKTSAPDLRRKLLALPK